MSNAPTELPIDVEKILASITTSTSALREANKENKLSVNDQHLLEICESTIALVNVVAANVHRLSEISIAQQQTIANLNLSNKNMLELIQALTGVDVQTQISESHNGQELI